MVLFITAMDTYFQQVDAIAGKYQEQSKMTSPIVVAGLADTINNAVAGMARAKAAADALNTSATRLVGNLTAIESVQAQLDDANSQVEKAIEAVGGPLPDSGDNGGGASSAGITPHNPPGTAAQQGTSAQHVAPATEVAAAQVEAANAAGNAGNTPK